MTERKFAEGDRVEVKVAIYGDTTAVESPKWRVATVSKIFPPDNVFDYYRYLAKLDENDRDVCVSKSIRNLAP